MFTFVKIVFVIFEIVLEIRNKSFGNMMSLGSRGTLVCLPRGFFFKMKGFALMTTCDVTHVTVAKRNRE